jgi:hypothetical protein
MARGAYRVGQPQAVHREFRGLKERLVAGAVAHCARRQRNVLLSRSAHRNESQRQRSQPHNILHLSNPSRISCKAKAYVD